MNDLVGISSPLMATQGKLTRKHQKRMKWETVIGSQYSALLPYRPDLQTKSSGCPKTIRCAEAESGTVL